jgi:hypothetical protein
MTDRELLEDAAKAAGMNIEWQPCGWAHNNETGCEWNPLTDDGDALRLAVKLGISILSFPACIGTRWPLNNLPVKLIGTDPPYEDISSGQDPLVATRRAIVRAAAEIGRNMT